VLRDRLQRRGLAAALLALIAAEAARAIPAIVETGLATAAASFAVGKSPSTGPVSERAIALARGEIVVMARCKLKALLGTLVAVGLALGTGAGTHPCPAGDQPRKADSGAAAPAASPAKEPAWKAAFRNAYALADAEVLKRVAPPFPPPRADFCRSWGAAGNARPDDLAIAFRWNGRVPEGWSLCTRAFALQGLLNIVVGVPPYEVEGEKELLATPINGDIIFRANTPPEELLAPLERIFHEATGRRLRLTFCEKERVVAIARGKLVPHSLDAFRENYVALFARPPGARMAPPQTTPPVGGPVLARGLTVPRGGGEGSLDGLLRHVAEFTGRRVINKTESVPDVKLTWREYYRQPASESEQAEDRDPELVLRNVAKQTGLTFESAKRKVRVLVVEEP
jgi:hypothetical protein